MSDEIRMTLLHHSTNDLIEELLMWRGLAAEHLDRIAELEAVIDQLIEVSEKMFTAVIAAAVPYDEGMRIWDALVNDWKEREE